MSRAIALSCPLCGGAVEPPVDARQISCGYCGRRLHYGGEDFLPRLTIAPALTDEELQRRFFDILRSRLVPGDLRRRAVVIHKRRLFFPLFLLSGTRGGVLHTVKERVVQEFSPRQVRAVEAGSLMFPGAPGNESARTSVESSPDARVVLGDFQYIYSAAAVEEWDFDSAVLQSLARERLPDAEPAVLADLARRGVILEATIPVERALEMGVASWRKGSGEGPEILETTVRLLYVPLVEIVFRYGEQIHRILLEEMTGSALAGRLPFGREMAFAVGIPAAGFLGLLLGKTARMLVFDPEWSAGTFGDAATVWIWFALIASVLFAGALQFIWMLLRAPVDVELMTGGGLKLCAKWGADDSPAGPLLRFVAAAAEALLAGVRR